MSRSRLLQTSGIAQLHFLCCKHNFSAKSAVSCLVLVLLWSTLLLLFKYKSSDTFKLSRQRRFTFNIVNWLEQNRSLYFTHTHVRTVELYRSLSLYSLYFNSKYDTNSCNERICNEKITNKQTNCCYDGNKNNKAQHNNRFGQYARIYFEWILSLLYLDTTFSSFTLT